MPRATGSLGNHVAREVFAGPPRYDGFAWLSFGQAGTALVASRA